MLRSPRLRSLTFQLGLGVLLFAAAELVVRDLVPPPAHDPYGLLRLMGADGVAMIGQRRDVGAFVQDVQALLQPDVDLLWTLRPELSLDASRLSLEVDRPWTIHTNASGFRDRPDSDRPTGEIVVVALGDSSTFGWGVEDDQAWPPVLEQELGDGWQVFNLGVPGYSAVQGQALLKSRQADLVPDVLVLSFGSNGGHKVARSDLDTLLGRRTLFGVARHTASQSRIFQIARQRAFPVWLDILGIGWQLGGLRARVATDDYRNSLLAMAAQAPQTVLVDVCTRAEYSAVMVNVAHQFSGISLVRYDQVHGETLDGCHPTPVGDGALAAALAMAVLGAQDPQEGDPPLVGSTTR